MSAIGASINSYGNTALLILSQPVVYNNGWRTRFFNADPSKTSTLDCTLTTYYVKTA